MGIEQFLNKIIEKKLGKSIEKEIDREIDKIIANDECKSDGKIKKELCDDLIEKYRTILELLNIKPTRHVQISADDLTAIVVDGKSYNLDECFSHNDAQATECIMAIESLFCDLRDVSSNIDRDISYIEDKLTKE